MKNSIDLNLVGKRINNEKFCAYLKKTIQEQWRCRKDIYPSTVPVLFNRTDFDKLNDYDYLVSIHLKEKHVILFFTTDTYNKKLCILCDKLFNFYKVNIKCLAKVYYNSLFDCQILKNKSGEYVIYLNDCVCIYGESIKNMAFEYRNTNIEMFLQNHIIELPDKLFLLNKSYFRLGTSNLSLIKYLIKEYNSGLVFTPNNLPIISGTQKSNMFWLPLGEHTIDLQVDENEGTETLTLNSYNFKNIFKYAEITNKDLIDKIKTLENYSNGCIVEFRINNQNLIPVMVKQDKLYPNGLRVIEMVLYTITENIKLNEFNIDV